MGTSSHIGLRRPGTATAIGFIAVLLWSSLALLTALAGDIPPFEMLALSFGIAFAFSLIVIGRGGIGAFRDWRQPPAAWATAFLGIFVYHALYFFALQAAPPAEASLIAYLWPLLIVVMSSMATGERMSRRLLAGAFLGLAGTGLIVARHGLAGTGSGAGYAAALACAFVWSGYSILNRRFRDVPSNLMGGICGLVAVAGLACHLVFETWAWPTALQWLALAGLGVGPVGAAFFAWDHATKHGRPAVLGVLSYLAPLISTLLLIACGRAEASSRLVGAAILILAGAAAATLTPGRLAALARPLVALMGGKTP